MECRGVLQTAQFDYWKGLGNRDAFLCVAHTLESALDSEREARIIIYCSDQLQIKLFRLTCSTIRDPLPALLFGSWRFCVVCPETVSL